MLLFSAVLDINDTLDRDAFIQLVIEWNRTSSYRENIIPGLEWDGKLPFSRSTDSLAIEIEEYRGIAAARFRKTREDGSVWDTEYIMNPDEGKISVRLERSYLEEALQVSPRFSTPHFITLLIENGYLKDDQDLPVSREPVFIDEKNAGKIINVIRGTADYALPVIYVSKTYYDEDPLDVYLLASRVKGTAHVLVQKNVWSNSTIQPMTMGKNEYHGALGIYFPSGKIPRRRLMPGNYEGSAEALLEKTVQIVVDYSRCQVIPPLYTWNGIRHAVMMEELQQRSEETKAARQAEKDAVNEMQEVYDVFDRDLEKLKKRIEELTKENEALVMENRGLRSKLGSYDSVPVLCGGSEKDLYPNEVREILLDSLREYGKNLVPHTRRADVIEDLLANNPDEGILKERVEILRQQMKDYKTMSGPLRQLLYDLGFTVTEEGKHYRLTYYNDSRYKTTISKSGSDHREGRNIIRKIIGTMM